MECHGDDQGGYLPQISGRVHSAEANRGVAISHRIIKTSDVMYRVDFLSLPSFSEP